jgi:hypothetical protein
VRGYDIALPPALTMETEMGTTYQLMLFDDFDWKYVGKDKDSSLKAFAEEFKACSRGWDITEEAKWSKFAVFDLDKQYPLSDERKLVIKKYSDSAWFNRDTSMWEWIKIE